MAATVAAKERLDRLREYSLRVDDVASALQCSRWTVLRWTKEGRLRHLKCGKKIFYRPADIEAFAERHIKDEREEVPS